jgi:hypothetical protein
MPTPSADEGLTLSATWFAALFRTIWENTVRGRYEMGVINSERALQACIVEALSPLAPEIVALVEPTVGGIRPDLWIGSPKLGKALAIVEIKYKPYAYPELGKDFLSFLTILSAASGLSASDVNPMTGKDRNGIICDHDTIGIYAVIGKHGADAVRSKILKNRTDVQELAKHRVLHAWGSVPHDSGTKLDFGTGWISGP